MTAVPSTVAVIVPALNEEGNIADLIAEIRVFAASVSAPVEIKTICIVDNGSTDATAAVARAAGARVVSEPTPGYGRACFAGALACDDVDILVFMDGDRSEVPGEMGIVLAPLLTGRADLVVGSRITGHAEPGALTPQQIVGNRVATVVMAALFRIKITDLGPYRAIRRSNLLALGMTEMTYGWPTEMIARAAHSGLRFYEVPVTCRRRASGVSKVSGNFKASARTAWRVFSTIFNVRRSPKGSPGNG